MPLTKTPLHVAASVMLVAALALLAWGLPAEEGMAWKTGLGVLALAMATAFLTRFVPEHAD